MAKPRRKTPTKSKPRKESRENPAASKPKRAKAQPKRAKAKAKPKLRSKPKSKALTIEGVLASHSAGLKSRDSWTLVFSLMPWQRMDTRAFDERPLRVQVPGMTEGTLQRNMGRLHTGTTVRVCVAEIEERKNATPLGVARAPVRVVKGSPELATARTERDKPVEDNDPSLGKLTLNREYDWFEGTWKPGRCDLRIEQSGASEDPERDARDIKNAVKRLARLEKLMPAIARALPKHLLSLYNDTWRDGGPVLSAAEFMKDVKLSSVVVHRSKRITLYYKPTRLFLQHGPEVRVEDGKISEVLIS